VLLRDVLLEAHLREGFAHARDRLELRRRRTDDDGRGRRESTRLVSQRAIDDVAMTWHISRGR
jgi:hypothetical protein